MEVYQLTFITTDLYAQPAVSAARGASRATESAAKITSAEEVLPTSGLRATAMELPNIEWIFAVNKTV